MTMSRVQEDPANDREHSRKTLCRFTSHISVLFAARAPFSACVWRSALRKDLGNRKATARIAGFPVFEWKAVPKGFCR